MEHVSADLGDPAAPRRVMSLALHAFGHVDVLVANHACSSQQDLFALTAAELDASFAVNAREAQDAAPVPRARDPMSGRHRGPCRQTDAERRPRHLTAAGSAPRQYPAW